MLGRAQKLLLTIRTEEATFARRGFRAGEAGAVARLERSGKSFLAGYHSALEHEAPAALAARLDARGRPIQKQIEESRSALPTANDTNG